MTETYDFKIIKSGREIEVYDYKDKEYYEDTKEKNERIKGKKKSLRVN